MIQNWKFQRGDIFFTRFDNAIGSEQSGNRPAVVLQNDVGNFYSPTLIVATLTSKAAKKYTQPTHCLLVNEFLSVPSIVQAEQIFTIDKSRVLKYLGHLTPEEMSRVDDAVRASLALNPMGSIVVFIDRSPAECYNKFRMLWIGEALLPQRRFLGGSNHSFFVEMLIS